ncbi:MAG: anaerobic ribonucleoside-triphosphate reductase activating protein [Acidaminococcaceae bacterium]
MLKVADILAESVVDGVGIRTVVFLQGCPRHCKGCHNEALLPFSGGTAYTAADLVAAITTKLTPLHRGVTFSGGDPLAQAEGLATVIALLRQKAPRLTMWVYTGYTYEEVKTWPVLEQIDVLVDGPFILEQRDLSLPFRGSGNQRIIDVPASLQAGQVVAWTK